MDRTFLTHRHPQVEEYVRAMNRGLGSGKGFAALLNQQTPVAERIREMFLTLRSALALAQDIAWHGKRGDVDDLIERFNEQAGRYTGVMAWTGMFWPRNESALRRIKKQRGGLYLTEDEKERFVFLPPEPITSFRKVADVPNEEWNGYLSLLKLMREKQIGRVRRCEMCEKWMWVRVPDGDRHQRFCPGGACASKWRKSSEYRTQQAAYMQGWRKTEKEKQAAALKAIEAKKRRKK